MPKPGYPQQINTKFYNFRKYGVVIVTTPGSGVEVNIRQL